MLAWPLNVDPMYINSITSLSSSQHRLMHGSPAAKRRFGVDLALESTQCFFDVYDTLLSTYTESG